MFLPKDNNNIAMASKIHFHGNLKKYIESKIKFIIEYDA